MRQIVELQPHAVVVVLLKRHAANFLCHRTPPRPHLRGPFVSFRVYVSSRISAIGVRPRGNERIAEGEWSGKLRSKSTSSVQGLSNIGIRPPPISRPLGASGRWRGSLTSARPG